MARAPCSALLALASCEKRGGAGYLASSVVGQERKGLPGGCRPGASRLLGRAIRMKWRRRRATERQEARAGQDHRGTGVAVESGEDRRGPLQTGPVRRFRDQRHAVPPAPGGGGSHAARLPRVRMVASRSFSACATPTWPATASSLPTGKRLLSSRTSRPRLWSSGAGGRPKPGTWPTRTPRTQPTPPRRLR